MRPLYIYVETSVFGFIRDETEVNRLKRESTLRLFEQLSEGRLIGYVSAAVLAELLQTPDEKMRNILIDKTRRLQMLSNPEPLQFDFLVNLYMTQKAFPPEKRDDAMHVAFMVLNPFLDAMITWNCRHLANENNRRYLRALTIAEGYPFHFEIITPEEALVYD